MLHVRVQTDQLRKVRVDGCDLDGPVALIRSTQNVLREAPLLWGPRDGTGVDLLGLVSRPERYLVSKSRRRLQRLTPRSKHQTPPDWQR